MADFNRQLPKYRNGSQHFANIAAVKLGKNFSYLNPDAMFAIFNLLTIKWSYMPSDIDLEIINAHFGKFYGGYFADYFKEAAKYQKELFRVRSKKSFIFKSILKSFLYRLSRIIK